MVFQLRPALSKSCYSGAISGTHGRVGWRAAYLRVGGTEENSHLGLVRAGGRARGANVFLPSELETRKQTC